ncbi:hypothetical protein AB0O97_18850, partial [Specibacter sp. NPDC078692]
TVLATALASVLTRGAAVRGGRGSKFFGEQPGGRFSITGVSDAMLRSNLGRIRIVDVKPKSRLEDPETVAVFDWTVEVCAQHGWDYEVWSWASETMLRNIKMLACGRLSTHLDRQLAMRAIDSCNGSAPLVDIVRAVCPSETDEMAVRPVILHLLWRGILAAHMETPITDRTLLILRMEESGEFNL